MSDTVDISYATIPFLIDYMISVYKKGIAKDTSAFARHSKLCNSSDYRWAPGIICGPRDHCNVPCSSPISSQGLLSWFLGDQKLTGGDYIGIGPRDENLAPGVQTLRTNQKPTQPAPSMSHDEHQKHVEVYIFAERLR
jgi:hypothetical protein